MREIETCLNKHNSKRAYRLVNALISEKQGSSATINEKSGKCLDCLGKTAGVDYILAEVVQAGHY